MNKLLIEILQRIPENATPTIYETSTSGVIRYDNGTKFYSGEMGWMLTWFLPDYEIALWVFDHDVYYNVNDLIEQYLHHHIPFVLDEFVEYFKL